MGEPPKIIKKTPFAKTFGVDKGVSPLTLKQVQVLDLPAPTLTIVPKIKPPRVTVPKVIPTPPTLKGLPYMVGGAGLVTIPFAGKGLYEVTEPAPSFVGMPSVPKPGTTLPLYEGPQVLPSKDMFEPLAVTREAIIQPVKVSVKPIVLLGMKPEVRVEEVMKLKTLTRVALAPVIKPALLPKVREIVRVAQVPALRLRLVQKLKVTQQLVTPSLVVSRVIQRPRPTPRPREFKVPPPIPKFELPDMRRRPPRNNAAVPNAPLPNACENFR